MFLLRLTYWEYTGSSEMPVSELDAQIPHPMHEEAAGVYELFICIGKWWWIQVHAAFVLSWPVII